MLENVSKVVSHHGGVELFYSGGIRRGTDVVKALAYGAKAVFLDPETVYWALAFEQTTTKMLQMLNEELKLAMVLTHCMSVREITVLSSSEKY